MKKENSKVTYTIILETDHWGLQLVVNGECDLSDLKPVVAKVLDVNRFKFYNVITKKDEK